MAADNHTTIIGNLVEDPEVRFTNTGIAVTNLRVAVTQRVQQDGQWRDGDTSFFKVNVWRSQAEHLAESLTEVGASLKWATAKVERSSQRGNGERTQGRERAAERGGDFNDQPPLAVLFWRPRVSWGRWTLGEQKRISSHLNPNQGSPPGPVSPGSPQRPARMMHCRPLETARSHGMWTKHGPARTAYRRDRRVPMPTTRSTRPARGRAWRAWSCNEASPRSSPGSPSSKATWNTLVNSSCHSGWDSTRTSAKPAAGSVWVQSIAGGSAVACPRGSAAAS
jgi:Single-strand binding protein family